jgi:transposase
VRRKPGQYSAELRAEVVKAVLDGSRRPTEVAREFGLVAETVRTWVKREQQENPGTTGPAREAIDRARVATLERRVRELEQENAFLKKAASFFAREQP